MSHHIYTTPAIILDSFPGKEADRLYTLFTEELGVVRASAAGIRRGASKLRYALQDFSIATVSLVRGREWWRITNAAAEENIFWRERSNSRIVDMVARIFRFLIRLVPGEEKNERLFAEVANALHFLTKHELKPKEIAAFEQVLTLRILNNLGYVGENQNLQPFVKNEINELLLGSASTHHQVLARAIDFSLQHSQL